MIYYDEQRQEYEMMYNHVMKNSQRVLTNPNQIIEYLVAQCYYIDLYNNHLIDIINDIKSKLGFEKENKIKSNYEIPFDDLPF